MEDLTCTLAENFEQAEQLLKTAGLALLVDEKCEAVEHFKPLAVVDAIIAKKNIGMHKDMAPITVALGFWLKNPTRG